VDPERSRPRSTQARRSNSAPASGFRVLDVVQFEEADDLGFVGMLKVEVA
jgi:hypothetical protein